MQKLQFFVNDNFNMLAYLYDQKNQKNLATATQYDLSYALSMSYLKTERTIQALIDAGYIEKDGIRIDRYKLTDEAIRVVELFRQL